jgi:peptidoglycan hydrolase CwlO-like protein
MFKQGVQDALVGTPLSEWPAISRSQVKELEFFNVRTVEQLAQMPDTAVQNFSGVSGLRTRALRYMEEAKDGAALNQMQTELETRDNTIQTLMNQVKEMQSQIAGLQNTTLVDKPTVEIKKSKREIKG